MHVVATAGHVDHGKSTLVRALTGVDPDRWPAEKARGLTIDLGFAHMPLPSGRPVSFVDVPGHIRFLRNMLAGVSAVDACLFVVAATEGWKPQSEEHLQILDILGVPAGVIVVTNSGRVDSTRAADVRDQIRQRAAGTFLEEAPILTVDSLSGIGLDALVSTLDEILGRIPPADDRGRPRLWVDRSFAIRGAGTVVTGTLAGGSFKVGAAVRAIGPGPLGTVGDRDLRIRGLQVHGSAVAAVLPGHRVAVNLAGVGHRQIRRGDALVSPDQWHHSRAVDATLRPLSGLGHPVSRRGSYALYVGSGEYAVTLRVIGMSEIAPNEQGAVRLYLPVGLPLLPGDHYVLRDDGRGETVGGGMILDVDPVRSLARATPSLSVDRVIAERGWVDVDTLRRLTGAERPATVAGRWLVDDELLSREVSTLEAQITDAGEAGMEVATLDEKARALLDRLPAVAVSDGWARLVPDAATDDPPGPEPWLQALAANPWSPPDPWACGADRVGLRRAVNRGAVVSCDGVYFAADAVEGAAAIIAGLLVRSPAGVTVGAVRDALGTTRKHVLPLLAHLDACGITRRRGDLRVGGPRIPHPIRPPAPGAFEGSQPNPRLPDERLSPPSPTGP
ncbi:MAG: SelB C-terminal domain-containing protein [Actinomycetota bacterium]|nr:SelB C-terminal domain-containing protein [Actinomycetota bacterium]